MVVAVKNNNIESNKMNLLIVAYEFSTCQSPQIDDVDTAKNHEGNEIDCLV